MAAGSGFGESLGAAAGAVVLVAARAAAREIPKSPPLLPHLQLHHQKLGSHFLQSDERRRFPYPVEAGTTPLAAFFIFGNEAAERMAYYGLSLNMVIFMFKVIHRPFSASANAVNTFLGISQASSVLGGFLVGAYLGRYWTITAFTTLYLLGLVALTFCATLPVLVSAQDRCDKLALMLGGCHQPAPWQMAYLYATLYVTANSKHC